jgi:1,4-alpha-glucan branching enzyme
MSTITRPKATHATRFACRAPEAKAVFLAGTFNGWNTTATRMAKGAGGNWSVAVDLPPGHYEYKYVVDGRWCCEPPCDGLHRPCQDCVPNEFGTMNRVIEVPKS